MNLLELVGDESAFKSAILRVMCEQDPNCAEAFAVCKDIMAGRMTASDAHTMVEVSTDPADAPEDCRDGCR